MIGKLQSIFQDTDFLDKELVEDVIIELKQAFNTVNIYSDILTGTMDAFASIISNNVNAITDDPDIDSQFLRNECGYPSGRDAVCLCTDYPVLCRAVDISVYRIPENQVVLIQATAIQAVLNLPLRQRHKKAACHS